MCLNMYIFILYHKLLHGEGWGTVGNDLGNYMNTRFGKSHKHDCVNCFCILYILSTNVYF